MQSKNRKKEIHARHNKLFYDYFHIFNQKKSIKNKLKWISNFFFCLLFFFYFCFCCLFIQFFVSTPNTPTQTRNIEWDWTSTQRSAASLLLIFIEFFFILSTPFFFGLFSITYEKCSYRIFSLRMDFCDFCSLIYYQPAGIKKSTEIVVLCHSFNSWHTRRLYSTNTKNFIFMMLKNS